jgi:hypothetical protein
MGGLLTGYNTPILVHHKIGFGQATGSLLACSIPNLAARSIYTLSLHYLEARKLKRTLGRLRILGGGSM